MQTNRTFIAPGPDPVTLRLYGTSCCHLCEQAHDMLHKICDRNSILLDEVDIADDEHLVQLYGLRIPVLQHADTGKLLCWPFTEADVASFIDDLFHSFTSPA